MNRVELHEDLKRELEEVPDVIPSLFKRVILLREKGVSLSPPYAKRMDVPQGTHSLMNLRFNAARGVWRVPYCLVNSGADRYFLLLAIGDKQGIEAGGNESRRFYEDLVHRSQQRLDTTPVTVVWP